MSPIDGRSLTGVSSIRVMQPRDYKGQGRRLLRWTELFLLHTDESGRKTVTEDSSCDVTRFAETVAKAAAMALAVKLDSLDPHTLVGLRFTLDGDTVTSSPYWTISLYQKFDQFDKFDYIISLIHLILSIYI